MSSGVVVLVDVEDEFLAGAVVDDDDVVVVLSHRRQRSETSTPFAERELSSEIPSPKPLSETSMPLLVVGR